MRYASAIIVLKENPVIIPNSWIVVDEINVNSGTLSKNLNL